MKLLSFKHKIFLLRRARKLHKRKLRCKEKHFNKVYLTAPENLDLELEETLKFLNDVRNYSNNFRFRTKIDFTKIKSITPSCALVFASELDRYCKIRSSKWRRQKLKVVNFDKWDSKIKTQLYDMGLFDLLDITNIDKRFISLSESEDIKFMKFMRNNEVSGEYAGKFKNKIASLIDEDVPDSKKLQIGLTEAMTNVLEHAYPVEFMENNSLHDKLWWVSASINKQSKVLNIIFFDQGIGIPQSLPKTNPEHFRNLLGMLDDSNIIRAATQIGRTKTGKKRTRGRGLAQIIDYGRYSEGSNVKIHSGRGIYILHEKDNKQSDYLLNKQNSINGTLIEWQINL